MPSGAIPLLLPPLPPSPWQRCINSHLKEPPPPHAYRYPTVGEIVKYRAMLIQKMSIFLIRSIKLRYFRYFPNETSNRHKTGERSQLPCKLRIRPKSTIFRSFRSKIDFVYRDLVRSRLCLTRQQHLTSIHMAEL